EQHPLGPRRIPQFLPQAGQSQCGLRDILQPFALLRQEVMLPALRPRFALEVDDDDLVVRAAFATQALTDVSQGTKDVVDVGVGGQWTEESSAAVEGGRV